jgi:hypothetical protein
MFSFNTPGATPEATFFSGFGLDLIGQGTFAPILEENVPDFENDFVK